MKFILGPWQLMLIIFADWINRQPQKVIGYLRPEIPSTFEELRSQVEP